MRILLLTPGTGSFICGSCSRDNLLSAALQRQGHETQIVPLYLPFEFEAGAPPQEGSSGTDVHMGGINVYLQQKLPLLAHLPRFLRKWLNAEGLLRWASTKGDMTNPAALGDMTLSMLRGEEGRQGMEIDRLLVWLEDQPAPDVVLLSNAMLIGLARRLKQELKVPVLCTLQGEQPFLDALHPKDSAQAWAILSERARELDGFVAVSRFTGQMMGERLGLNSKKVHVVHNGIELDGFEPATQPPAAPTIGFLARMCEDKGLPVLVDAFLELVKDKQHSALRLVIVGVLLSEDRKLVKQLQARCARAGVAERVEFHPNVSRPEKVALLKSFSLLCVPAAYGESFGLYLLEAMACGIPVVQPRTAGFTEVLEATGGGILYDPEAPQALEQALKQLLLDTDAARSLGETGRASVHAQYTADRMAADVAQVCQGVLDERVTAL